MKKINIHLTVFAVPFILAGLAMTGCDDKESAPPAEMSGRQVVTSQPAVAKPAPASSPLLSPETANAKAPEVFKAKFSTTKGDFVIEVHRSWAPYGADRFYNLVKVGFFKDVAFFRVLPGFMVQFGIHGSPEVMAKWRGAPIPDDKMIGHSNAPGTITYATSGPNSRTTQLFISYGNNAGLDGQGFTPFGKIVKGMDVVNSIYKGYGGGPDEGGRGPSQGRFQAEGNAYINRDFPKMDFIKSASLVE